MILPVKSLSLYMKYIWYIFLFYSKPIPEENHYANIGTVFFELEKYSKAIFFFNKSEESHSSKGDNLSKYNLYYIGYCYLNIGNHVEAAKYFEEYLDLAPDDAEITEFLGWCYQQQNDNETALKLYARLIEIEPDLIKHRLESAQILFELDNKDKAFTQLEYARDLSNGDVALDALITGMRYKFDGDLEKAADKFNQAIKVISEAKNDLYPQLDDLYVFLSDIYREMGDESGALAILEYLFTMNPNDLWNANCLALEYADQEVKLKTALKIINRCLKYQPKNAYFLDTKGWILFKLNNGKEAKRYINASLKLNPYAKDTKEHYQTINSSVNSRGQYRHFG